MIDFCGSYGGRRNGIGINSSNFFPKKLFGLVRQAASLVLSLESSYHTTCLGIVNAY
jgi:hypothetical protein